MELLTKKEAEFKALKNSQPTRSVGTEDAEGAASERLTRGVGTWHLRVRASEGAWAALSSGAPGQAAGWPTQRSCGGWGHRRVQSGGPGGPLSRLS